MLALPEGPAGRALAVTLTVIAVVMSGLAVVTPLLDFQADEGRHVEARAQTLIHMQALVARLPRLQADDMARGATAPEAGLLLQGQTDAIAAAELQQRVQQMVQERGGRLISIEMLQTEPVGAYRRIALRVSLSAAYSADIAILRSLADARPAMLVDDLKLQALGIRNEATPMDAGFTVLAYRAAAPS